MNDSAPVTSASPTRRRILAWGGVGTLAGVAGYLGWRGESASEVASGAPGTNASPAGELPSKAPLPGQLSGRNAFLPHLNSEFRVETSAVSPSAACVLVKVGDEMAIVAPTARFVSYSLLFSAPKGFVAESCVYRVSHPQMEPMELFLSPVGKSDEAVFLEAVCSLKV